MNNSREKVQQDKNNQGVQDIRQKVLRFTG